MAEGDHLTPRNASESASPAESRKAGMAYRSDTSCLDAVPSRRWASEMFSRRCQRARLRFGGRNDRVDQCCVESDRQRPFHDFAARPIFITAIREFDQHRPRAGAGRSRAFRMCRRTRPSAARPISSRLFSALPAVAWKWSQQFNRERVVSRAEPTPKRNAVRKQLEHRAA